ncbi:M23 family metallopeptidase [bacterium]|nr:M23 family metallopeptidase [bacterium]
MLSALSKKALGIFCVVGVSCAGLYGFRFFTHAVPPNFKCAGLEEKGFYAGNIVATVEGNSGYKIDTLSVKIDGKAAPGFPAKIKSKNFSRCLKVDTQELGEGKHTCEMVLTDASFNANESRSKFRFSVDNKPFEASFKKPEYEIKQGNTIHVKINANKSIAGASVEFLSREYPCCQESTAYETTFEAFVPVDCDESAATHLLTANVVDKVGNKVELSSPVNIEGVEFPNQMGFYVPPQKLEDERDVSVSNSVLSNALEKWLQDSPKEKLWSGKFELPTVVKRLSTPYGERRVSPERGKYLHKAVDIVNSPKSVVWASQSGKVIIKDRFLLSGNTVVIDHGLGVFTEYFHLDSFADIEVGQMVKKGNPVGKLGKTGYAAGYHLHWALLVNNQPINPMEWTEQGFWA